MSSGVPRKVRIGLARVRPITVRRMDAESRMYTVQAMPLRTLLPSPAPKYWDVLLGGLRSGEGKKQIDNG